MNQIITIKKVILELHTGSQQLVDEAEQDFRDAIYNIVTPAVENYFSRMQERGTVLRTDRLVLDLGEIRPEFIQEDVRRKIVKCLDGGVELKFEGPVYHAQEEVTALQAVMHFLLTGVLPWNAFSSDGKPLLSLLGFLVRKDPESIRSILHHAGRDRLAFQRLVLHVPDETLREMFGLFLSPTLGRMLWEALAVLWNDLASFSSARQKRLRFWQLALEVLMAHGNTHDAIHAFLAGWVARHRGDAPALLRKIYDAAENEPDIRSALSRLFAEPPGTRMTLYYVHKALHHTLAVIESEISGKMIAGPRYIAGIQLRMLETIAHYLLFLPDQLRRHFTTITDELVADVPEADPVRFKNAVEHELKAMELFLEKLQQVGEHYTFNNDAIVNVIRELVQKKDHINSLKQFSYLLEKMDQVLGALPPSALSTELSGHVERVKQKLGIHRATAGSAEHASLLRRIGRHLASGSDGILAGDAGVRLHALLRSLLPAIFPAQKQEALRVFLDAVGSNLEKPEAPEERQSIQQHIRALIAADEDDDNAGTRSSDLQRTACHESYVANAGLVLIAPFIRMLFEQTTLTEGDMFRDDEARAQAAMVLQYIATGEAGCNEYDMSLNKVLCGLGITDPIDLLQPLDTTLKEEADNMLESVLQQAPAFRNISLAGFRNAFMKREGVLNVQDNPLLLRVSRESFDIVLEKVPWQYHIVRLPWMHQPLMIEW